MYLFYRIMYKLIQNEYYMSHQNAPASFSLFIFILPRELSPGGDGGDPGRGESDSLRRCLPAVVCFPLPSHHTGKGFRSTENGWGHLYQELRSMDAALVAPSNAWWHLLCHGLALLSSAGFRHGYQVPFQPPILSDKDASPFSATFAIP